MEDFDTFREKEAIRNGYRRDSQAAREQAARERANERSERQEAITQRREEMRRETVLDTEQLKQNFRPEEILLLFDDYVKRRNVEIQALQSERTIEREDEALRNIIQIRYEQQQMYLRLEEHIFRSLIDRKIESQRMQQAHQLEMEKLAKTQFSEKELEDVLAKNAEQWSGKDGL